MPTTPRLKLPYPAENASPWYELFTSFVEAVDVALYTSREDRNIVLTGGGTVAFNATTGVLSWSAAIYVLASVTGYRWRIDAGSKTLADGEIGYITVARGPQSETSYEMQAGTTTPNEPYGDSHILICARSGQRLHFRDGFVMNDDDSLALFEQSTGSSSGGGDITDEIVTWSPTASPNGEAQSIHKTHDTANETPATALTVALPDESFADLTATVIGRSEDDQHFAIDLRATWSRTNGTVTERRAPATSNALGTNPAGWAAVFVLSGTNALVRVTGEAALAIRWSVLASAQIVTLDAEPAPSGYDPAVLSLTGWWRADYAASPWTPTASAGTSGANGDLAEATNPPTVGTAVNALDPAAFDGADDLATGTAAMSDLVSAGAGSIAVLFNADTAAAPGAGVYDDEPLFCDSTANIAIGFSSSGVRGGYYDTGASWKETAHVACATGGWHLAQMKWDGANIYVRVDSGAWVSVAAADFFLLTGLVRLGKNYNTAFFDGEILDVMTAATALSDATFDNLILYVNARYDLAL